MAYAYNEYTGTTDTDYLISFSGVAPGYLKEDHVKFYLNGVLQDNSLRTFIDSTHIQIAAPLATDVVRFRRESSIEVALVDWLSGAGVSAYNLDTNTLQMLYVAQESADVGDIDVSAAEAAEIGAVAAAALAEKWASEVEDTEVDTGMYSALHHAAKALTSATLAAANAAITTQDALDTAADAISTASDVLATTQDAIDTASDAAATAQDAINTANDAAATAQDAIDTANDVIATNADVVTTNQDALDTAADVVLTHADVVITNQDAIDTASDAVDTAADLVSVQDIYDEFDDRYLGAKAEAPTLDNDGDALIAGAMYFNTTDDVMYSYSGTAWVGINITLDHAASHQDGASDEISVAGLSGLLADDQHVLDAEVLAAAGVNSGITSLTGLSGQQTIPTINLTGGQIVFPATAVPSSDPNTLDDYEEGTWTVGVAFGGGTTGITYNASYVTGRYVKVGNFVSASGWVILTNKGSSTGNATITGLPFTNGTGSSFTAVSVRLSQVTFNNVPAGFISSSSASINLRKTTSGAGDTAITDADFEDISDIIVSCTYST